MRIRGATGSAKPAARRRAGHAVRHAPAEADPIKYHAVTPFHVLTGKAKSLDTTIDLWRRHLAKVFALADAVRRGADAVRGAEVGVAEQHVVVAHRDGRSVCVTVAVAVGVAVGLTVGVGVGVVAGGVGVGVATGVGVGVIGVGVGVGVGVVKICLIFSPNDGSSARLGPAQRQNKSSQVHPH